MNSLGVCANCPTNSSAVSNSCLCNSGYIMNSAGVCIATSTCPANSSGSPCVCNTYYYTNISTGACHQCFPPGTWTGTSCL